MTKLPRSELSIRMLCAWNDVPFEATRFHANEWTLMALSRVAVAVREFDAAQAAEEGRANNK